MTFNLSGGHSQLSCFKYPSHVLFEAQIELETKVPFVGINYHPPNEDHRCVHLTCYKKSFLFV